MSSRDDAKTSYISPATASLKVEGGVDRMGATQGILIGQGCMGTWSFALASFSGVKPTDEIDTAWDAKAKQTMVEWGPIGIACPRIPAY